MGGHVIDSSNHLTYSSTKQDISVRIIMIIPVQKSLNFMTADIGNTFFTAPCAEKKWTRTGEESRINCHTEESFIWTQNYNKVLS